MSTTTEIAVPTTSDFAVISNEIDIAELIHDNLAGEDFTPFDLDRITVPSGGGITWELPTASGIESLKELEAIIVGVVPTRAYWSEPMSGEGSAPDCTSTNMIEGLGDPGGECGQCPWNQFGSADNGSGKACKETRNVYILTRDTLLPYNLIIPPTSLKPFKQYVTSLTRYGHSAFSVTTKFTLEKTKSGSGITYSKIAFAMGSEVGKEAASKMKAYKAAFMQTVNNVSKLKQ